MFAGGLLLALIAAFALAAAAAPVPGPAAQTQAAFASEHPDLGAPDHASTCFERHYPCAMGAFALAPAQPLHLGAMPAAGFIKATALSALMRDVAPRAVVSFSILFRNFRE